MAESQTVIVQKCLDRLKAGDAAARDDLIRAACNRLERLTRTMLRDFKGVQRWEDAEDVLQNALLRLCRALKDVTPPSAAEFYRFAATQIRRELIDLARRHSGPEAAAAHHATQAKIAGGTGPEFQEHEATDGATSFDKVADWTAFHQQVEKLPPHEREVFDLIWYQELTQVEAADVLGIAERTVKRRWQSARDRLRDAFQGLMSAL